MFEKKTWEILANLFINVLSSHLYDEKNKKMEKNKLSILQKNIEEWFETFCKSNDGSILTSSSFINYVLYQYPFQQIYNYVLGVGSKELGESDFVSGLIEDCKESVTSSGRTISVDDERILRELFSKVVNKYKEYGREKLDVRDRYILNNTIQTISGVGEGIIENQNKSEDRIIKRVEGLLCVADDLSDDIKREIYLSLNNMLWEGNIEKISSILPLVQKRDQEIELALKMNLCLISDFEGEALYNMERIDEISCMSIKEDIIRRFILFNINNKKILNSIYERLGDSQLKQIVVDLINDNTSNIFLDETEVLNGAQIKKIARQEMYDSEQWLCNRIIFMYVYWQKHYNAYKIMNEFIKPDANIIERLLIWEKEGQELINEYTKDGKKDGLKNFYSEVKLKKKLFSKIKSIYKVKYFALLLKCAILIDSIEVDDIIDELPNAIKEEDSLKELIMFYEIKKGECELKNIVDFCQKTKNYALLHDALLQWASEPEKILNFVEDYKYLLSESLHIFLMYVQATRIVKGNEVSKEVCEKYGATYGDYLEYLLEIYRDCEDSDILNQISAKYKAGNILCDNYIYEEMLAEAYIQNGMYDDALTIIGKYETIKKINSRMLRMKAVILASTGKTIEALNIFIHIYDQYKEDAYVLVNILQLSLQNKRTISEEILNDAKKSSSWEVLLFVSMVYAREADVEMSRKFITMSLLRSGSNNVRVCGRYWAAYMGQEEATTPQPQNIVKDTAVILKNEATNVNKVYCVFSANILPNELFEWENIINISSQYAIKMGMYRKKVGDEVLIGEEIYIITEIMPVQFLLGKKCMDVLLKNGAAKGFSVDINEDTILNQEKFVEWLKENINRNETMDWLDNYKDYSQIPLPFYTLFQFTKLPYEQFVLSMLEENSIVIRSMINEKTLEDSNGYVLSFSALIMMYKMGISPELLNQIGVVIPTSVKQFANEETITSINENSRNIVASMGVYDGKLFMSETSEEEKQQHMETTIRIKEYVDQLKTIENNSEICLDNISSENIKEILGICDYDVLAIAKKQKMTAISGEAFMIMLSQMKDYDVSVMDIVTFFTKFNIAAEDIISCMQKMIEYQFDTVFSKALIDYLAEQYESVIEEREQEILEKWCILLNFVDDAGKEYKSILTQRCSEIMKEKVEHSNEYGSEIWRIFGRYVLFYNDIILGYGFDENGKLGIRTYRRQDSILEKV